VNAQALRVKRYYEANTRWMLARGAGRGEAVIHRPLWLPGVSGRREAVHAVDALIRDTLTAETGDLAPGAERPLRLLDMGCGAGGTAVWLAENLPGELTGVTLSPIQVQRARELARERNVAERCRFVQGDFLEESTLRALGEAAGQGAFHAVYAVEAFSHAADPGLFFARAAAQLEANGLLIVCDDFPVSPAAVPDGEDARNPPTRKRRAERRRVRWLQAFRQGWHLGPLPGEGETIAAARAQGLQLVRRRDLSPYLRGGRVWAGAVHGLLRLLPGRGPWISSRRGGVALQVCLRKRWVAYLYLVFRKA